MVIIADPRTGNTAEVNEENELVVRAITEAEIEHASGKLGSAYSWDSLELDITAGDTMLFVKNTGDTPLILDRCSINGSNVVCTWEMLIGSATTTPSGTEVIGKNINREFASKVADATALSNETAVADGDLVDRVKTPIDNTLQHNLVGIILKKNHYIQFNQETESDSGSIVLFGHFENPS